MQQHCRIKLGYFIYFSVTTFGSVGKDLLCLALLVQGVNGCLLDNCQVSSLPHDCVAYRTRLRDHLKAFAGVFS